MFDTQQVLRKEKKNAKENDFLIFGFIMKNTGKKNQIYLKLIRNLYTLKLFNLYIIDETKWNELKEIYKNIFKCIR